MEKKIAIPEGMLEAAVAAVKIPVSGQLARNQTHDILEAALRWLSENPIEPTQKQSRKLYADVPQGLLVDEVPSWYAVEWQRRMFLAPEPEVHEEDKDYVCTSCGVFHRGWTKPGHKTPCPACSGTSIEMRGYFPRRNESEDLEPVKDLLLPHLEGAVCKTDGINATIIEAYRRGKEAK